MKVRELIEQLLQFDGDLPVVIKGDEDNVEACDAKYDPAVDYNPREGSRVQDAPAVVL